jgi:hypothetical protein
LACDSPRARDPLATAIGPQTALVADDHLRDVAAVEREIDAVSNPADRPSSVAATWEATGVGTVLHARELVGLLRL